jgi:uncharacterized small protein (DUF1192 family)
MPDPQTPAEAWTNIRTDPNNVIPTRTSFNAAITALENSTLASNPLTTTGDTSEPLDVWTLDTATSNGYNNKLAVTTILEQSKTANAKLDKALKDSSLLNPDSISREIAALQTEINRLRAGRADEKKLMDLRKEQASALESKYASNLHTSWLGLWRPLSDQGQVGLGVFAFLFGVMAVAILGYLGYTLYAGGNLRLFGGAATAAVGAATTRAAGSQNFAGLFQ